MKYQPFQYSLTVTALLVPGNNILRPEPPPLQICLLLGRCGRSSTANNIPLYLAVLSRFLRWQPASNGFNVLLQVGLPMRVRLRITNAGASKSSTCASPARTRLTHNERQSPLVPSAWPCPAVRKSVSRFLPTAKQKQKQKQNRHHQSWPVQMPAT